MRVGQFWHLPYARIILGAWAKTPNGYDEKSFHWFCFSSWIHYIYVYFKVLIFLKFLRSNLCYFLRTSLKMFQKWPIGNLTLVSENWNEVILLWICILWNIVLYGMFGPLGLANFMNTVNAWFNKKFALLKFSHKMVNPVPFCFLYTFLLVLSVTSVLLAALLKISFVNNCPTVCHNMANFSFSTKLERAVFIL